MSLYGESFYENNQAGALSSARVVVPMVLDLVPAQRTIDVGCGNGAWPRVFMDCGVADARGVDGPWVAPEQLLIPRDRFRSLDLTADLPLDERYDLASSLEVAEHIPADAGDRLVRTLTRLAPVVLFSAAIPGQGGVNHVNEQWPEYWAERFAALGYAAVDCLRRRIWDDLRVRWWYAQNLLIFASEEGLERNPRLKEAAQTPADLRRVVHPGCFALRVQEAEAPSPRVVVRRLPHVPGLIAAGALRRVRRVAGARRPA